MKSKYDIIYIIVFSISFVCAVASAIINIMYIGGASVDGIMITAIFLVLALKIILSLSDLIALKKFDKQNPVNVKLKAVDSGIYLLWVVTWFVVAFIK